MLFLAGFILAGRLLEDFPEFIIGRYNLNYIRYSDDHVLMTDSERRNTDRNKELFIMKQIKITTRVIYYLQLR